ncbi:MAG: Gfo/Idh/MocA family oxidoreductase [Phycisphaerales bacterium]|nr:MAG: Gfo/Idh/MocA family oxidoreductase [Phycisphaerales bacterium]
MFRRRGTLACNDIKGHEKTNMGANRYISRRRFLRRTRDLGLLAVGFPYIVSASALGANGATPPSEKIVMGCVGVGSMGGGHLRVFNSFDDVEVVAACDLRKIFRTRAEERVGCKTYTDFRELMAREDIDAVCIATPDFWHALVAIEAAKNGKDMYMEKPVDVHVAAAKALREAVNRYGVVFQFGTQQRSGRDFRLACELVRNKRIGKLQTIVVGSLSSMEFPNQPTQPTPDVKEFNYDMWLGPAPWAPYTYERCASRAMGTDGLWTHMYDYSLGGLSGAWGIHHVDIAQWGNDTDHTGPVEVEGTGTFPKDGLSDTAIAWHVEHKYENGVTMVHTNSKNAAKIYPEFHSDKLQYKGCGILFMGTEGWVIVSRRGIDAHPKSLLKETIGPDEIRLPVSNNHRRNFIECVKTRSQPICSIETAVRSDTICHLDDIAMRLGRKLRWNPDKEEFINDERANQMLTRPLRSPWHL